MHFLNFVGIALNPGTLIQNREGIGDQCKVVFAKFVTDSVADPGCLSRIPDPDFYPSRIPDPKTAIKEREVEKKLVVIPVPFFVATNFTKLQIISFFYVKKNLINFQKILELFTPKIVTKVRDPGSGKNLFRIPDPGVKKAPDSGSVFATLVTDSASQCAPPPPSRSPALFPS